MDGDSFKKFLLQEGLRQDALIHNMAAQLGTKTTLLMVFGAFVFAAESGFVIVSLMFGLQLPRWGWGGSLILSIASIAVLLRSVWLEKYRIPPVLPLMRQQAEQFFALDDIKQLADDQQMEKFQEKFVNSLSRCIRDNFQANAKIHRNIEAASCLIAASMACLLGCLFWILH
jgi:hypothetical protein